MDGLKKFDLEHWWTLASAAGALITIAAVSVRFEAGVLVGLGLLLWGIAEWLQTSVANAAWDRFCAYRAPAQSVGIRHRLRPNFIRPFVCGSLSSARRLKARVRNSGRAHSIHRSRCPASTRAETSYSAEGLHDIPAPLQHGHFQRSVRHLPLSKQHHARTE
jgi:hypothetical protein